MGVGGVGGWVGPRVALVIVLPTMKKKGVFFFLGDGGGDV